MIKKKRTKHLYKKRIPYIIIYREPNSRLIDMVIEPHEAKKYKLHSTYYITKQIIPALDRIFSLLCVDVKKWYSELPKMNNLKIGKTTIDYYYSSRYCIICNDK